MNTLHTLHFGLCTVLVALTACSTGSTGNTAFDERFAALEKNGVPVIVESTGGGKALLGEVRRAADSAEPAEEAPAEGALGVAAAAPLEGGLPDSEVSKVVRRHVSSVGRCFQVAAREGTGQGGKAIVSLDIGTEGNVNGVTIEAPAFEQSSLPGCIQSRAKGWTFPKFTEGPKQASFPFVFAGQ